MLALCARLGMGKLGVAALDGMKIAANASKSANRTEETLRKKAAETVARYGQTDAAEDVLFGRAWPGTRCPRTPSRRGERIAAALASLTAERAAAEAERARKEAEQAGKEAQYTADASAGRPRAGNPPTEAAVELAAMKVERDRGAQQARIDAWEARAVAARQAGRPLRDPRPVPPGDYVRVRQARVKLDKALFSCHLHHFCPLCGAVLVPDLAGSA